ncbi:MAG: hypothetical protein K8R59_10530 [Thermoanaerobaculales bacterium]|nr:hypothetical protein [Thermoanaerobaculales bacterium]
MKKPAPMEREAAEALSKRDRPAAPIPMPFVPLGKCRAGALALPKAGVQIADEDKSKARRPGIHLLVPWYS